MTVYSAVGSALIMVGVYVCLTGPRLINLMQCPSRKLIEYITYVGWRVAGYLMSVCLCVFAIRHKPRTLTLCR